MHFSAPVPILPILSVDQAKAFYLDFLGFTLDGEQRSDANAPLVLQVRRAGLVLHLSEHPREATPGAAVFVPMHGVAELHAELTAKRDDCAQPVLDAVNGGVQLHIRDPFGNTLCFGPWQHAPTAQAACAVPGAPALGYYRHTDGGTYRVVGMARDSRDASDVVLYDHVWPFEQGRWTRPLPEWASRFTPITADEVARTLQRDRAADQACISAARRARKGTEG